MTTGPDEFADWDAAYALGALDERDRAAFEAHLTACPACRARVAEAESTAGLLFAVGPRGNVEPDSAEAVPVPDTLLPGLLRRAARERSRRRWVVGGLAAAAAACLAAFLVAVWPSDDAPSAPPGRQQAMVSLVSTPVTATAQLTQRPWGTQIDVKCRHEPHYDGSGPPPKLSYRLTVVDTAGQAHDAGGWGLGASGSTDFTGGTEVPRARITKVQVRLSNGMPILELAL